jgi:hypothetical protein
MEEHPTFCYAVTAYHVIKNLSGDKIPIRVQRKPHKPPKIFFTMREDWVQHPNNVDIAAYKIDWRIWDADKDLDLLSLTVPKIVMTKELEEHFGFGLGSDVFIPSGFVGMVGERQNISVVRFGHVAAMALEPTQGSPRRPAFLVEVRSLGGMSGAPVFFHIDPARRYRRESIPTDPETGLRVVPYFLIGMIIGTWHGQYASDFVTQDDIIVTDADFNSGIAVVLPEAQIIETISQRRLRVAIATSL